MLRFAPSKVGKQITGPLRGAYRIVAGTRECGPPAQVVYIPGCKIRRPLPPAMILSTAVAVLAQACAGWHKATTPCSFMCIGGLLFGGPWALSMTPL